MSSIVDPAAGVSPEAEVDLLAAVIRGVVGVVALGGGGPLQPATYLPGRRVRGLRLSTDRIEVAVTVAFGIPAAVVAERIRAALAVSAQGRPVDVHIADLQVPEGSATTAPGSS